MARKGRAPSDPRGGHTRLYRDIQDSNAWRALSFSAQCLWLAMRRDLLGYNNGDISATLSVMKHRGFSSSATLAKALRHLLAVGLIKVTRGGGVRNGSKVATLYRFTDEPTFDIPKIGQTASKETNEWKRFELLSHARDAIKQADQLAKQTSDARHTLQKMNCSDFSTPQKLNCVDSESELSGAILDSDSEQVGRSLRQKLNKTRASDSAPRTA
jgi:hypothetical protein